MDMNKDNKWNKSLVYVGLGCRCRPWTPTSWHKVSSLSSLSCGHGMGSSRKTIPLCETTARLAHSKHLHNTFNGFKGRKGKVLGLTPYFGFRRSLCPFLAALTTELREHAIFFQCNLPHNGEAMLSGWKLKTEAEWGSERGRERGRWTFGAP